MRNIEYGSEIQTGMAKSISAKELYIIFTQSNEFIELVDVRSEEEYHEKHIERSKHIVFIHSLFAVVYSL